MGRFPNWVRPDLCERILVGEEGRLAKRPGLSPEQVRADLITALAATGGDTVGQCQRALATATGIDHATIANALMGRQPVYNPLLVALYGAEPGASLLDEYREAIPVFGPFTQMARAAGLLPAGPGPIHSNSSAAGNPPLDHPPALAAAAALPTAAATEPGPAAPKTSSPAAQSGLAVGAPGSVRMAGGAGAGEGSARAAPPAVTAQEGSRSDGAAPAPSPEFVRHGLDPAMAALAALAQAAAQDVQRIEAEMAAAGTALVAARSARDRARQAYDLLDELRREGTALQVAA